MAAADTEHCARWATTFKEMATCGGLKAEEEVGGDRFAMAARCMWSMAVLGVPPRWRDQRSDPTCELSLAAGTVARPTLVMPSMVRI